MALPTPCRPLLPTALFSAALLATGISQAQGTIQIAQLEPLSGPFQTQGEGNARTLQIGRAHV